MIPKIKKILYATDLSAGANYAFGYALNVAMGNDAKVSIINVYEKHVNQTNISMRSNDFEIAKEKLTTKIKADLATEAAKLNKMTELAGLKAGQTTTPPVEPPGRAPDGESYSA